MAAVVAIVTKCGLKVELCYRNQRNETKLERFKLLICLKKTWSTLVPKVVMAYILGHLKEMARAFR